mmetsp:Transcript_22450/g.46114  ORF Transcript_22450/g.46114 Transcript_22450/m.46114 type:complete len:107 (+) Transcript_22450:577-897(+)
MSQLSKHRARTAGFTLQPAQASPHLLDVGAARRCPIAAASAKRLRGKQATSGCVRQGKQSPFGKLQVPLGRLPKAHNALGVHSCDHQKGVDAVRHGDFFHHKMLIL